MVDLNFGCYDVIQRLGLPILKETSTSILTDCPKCSPGSKKKKMQWNRTAKTVHCHKCGFGGKISSVYAELTNISQDEALSILNGDSGKNPELSVKYREAELKALKVKKSEAQKASNYTLNKTYRRFLELCDLSDKHLKVLTSDKRGLTPAFIKAFGFKTAPYNKNKKKEIIETLLSEHYVLKGVPGFFINEKGEWDINLYRYNKGILVPYCNENKQVLGFQICLDEPKGKSKYFWLSSTGKEKGTGSGSPIHLTTSKLGETIYFTEGALKADIAYMFSHLPFAAIAGVSNYSPMPSFFKMLKTNGVKRVVDCYDTDCTSNPEVEKARKKLKSIVNKSGLQYVRMKWDDQFKGIDDYMLKVPKNQWHFTCSYL